MTYVCDAGAERMSRRSPRSRTGRWEGEDVIDCDGAADDEAYRVHVRSRKGRAGRGRLLRQLAAGAHVHQRDVPGRQDRPSAIAFKYLFDPRGTFTSGLMRPIDIVLPEGTLVSAMPPDGAVFPYWEESQVMLAALLRALGQAVGERRSPATRRPDLHNAGGVHPNGMPWQSAGAGRRRAWRRGAARAGRRRHPMLTYQANGIGDPGRGGRVRRAGRRSCAARSCPTPPAPASTAAAPPSCATRSGCTPAEHYPMSLRYIASRGFGVNGGRDGHDRRHLDLGATARAARPPTTPDAYADAPLVGRLDPETHAPSRDGEYVCPAAGRSGTPRRTPCCATSTTAAAAGATRSTASPRRQARRPRRVRDDRGRGTGLRRRRRGRPGEDPEGLPSTPRRPERCGRSDDRRDRHRGLSRRHPVHRRWREVRRASRCTDLGSRGMKWGWIVAACILGGWLVARRAARSAGCRRSSSRRSRRRC